MSINPRIFVLIWFFAMLGTSALSIAMYVCGSLGTYTIANRRGINRLWLSWIPVVNVWTLGCISDQYQQVVCGKTTGRRKTLLTLNIIISALGVVFFAIYVYLIADLLGTAVQYGQMGGTEPEAFLANQLLSNMIPALIAVAIIILLLAVISIIAAVFGYIALYDLYRSANPDNAVLFLVLSIVFNITQPFFIFACRNKDLGMPPRQSTYLPPQNPPTF